MARKAKTSDADVSSRKQNRIFGFGHRVRVEKKSTIVDHDRAQEGPPPGVLPPIECDITGIEGTVTGPAYESKEKGEVCVPIQLDNEAVIAVPESRLEDVRINGDGMGTSVGYADIPDAKWTRAFGKKKRRQEARRAKR